MLRMQFALMLTHLVAASGVASAMATTQILRGKYLLSRLA